MKTGRPEALQKSLSNLALTAKISFCLSQIKDYLSERGLGVLNGNFAVVFDCSGDADGLARDISPAVQGHPTHHWPRVDAAHTQLVLNFAAERLL